MTGDPVIRFSKMHGIGNDFVMLDTLRDGLPSGDLAELSRVLCHRHKGVGGDGLILVEKGSQAPFRMRMFNPDGSESEMCGNGIRCFGKYIWDLGYADKDHVPVETGAGTLELERASQGIRVQMGKAEALGEFDLAITGLPKTGVGISMGNPHLVIFVPDVAAVPLEDWGPALETHPKFPNRTNVHFAQVVDRGHLIQRTWERGAGITLACGTGACATAAAAVFGGLADSPVDIRLPGGALALEVSKDATIHMTGPAETVFSGVWPG